MRRRAPIRNRYAAHQLRRLVYLMRAQMALVVLEARLNGADDLTIILAAEDAHHENTGTPREQRIARALATETRRIIHHHPAEGHPL